MDAIEVALLVYEIGLEAWDRTQQVNEPKKEDFAEQLRKAIKDANNAGDLGRA